MMLGNLKKIYRKLPTWMTYPLLKWTGGAPIFSTKHWRKVDRLEQKLEAIDLNEKLKTVANQCGQTSFYQQNHYKEFLTTPNLNLLKQLPLLDTETVRNHFEEIINYTIPGYYTTTGGSGRNPLKVYLSNKSYYIDRIHAFYAWSQLGYSKGDLKLTLRGVNLKDRLYEFNPMNNELNINVFLLNRKKIDEIVQVINKYKPVFGHGYPSAWYNFALLLKEEGLTLENSLKGIFFASESIDESKRDYVEKIMKAKVRSTYGFTERAGFAYELAEQKGVYKISLEYGLMEIIKDNGEPAKHGESGEIVCTGFINAGMPLIRYKTGDYATVNKIENDAVVLIENIQGRWGKDYIQDKNGNKIFTTSINVHTEAQFDFRYIQMEQKEMGSLVIRFVPFNELNKKSLEIVAKEFREKLPNIQVATEVIGIDDLYVTERGKIPYLIKNFTGK